MISYHPTRPDPRHPENYSWGFKSGEVVEPERVATCMRTYVWSPCVWVRGRRGQKNFASARWCVLDFDDGSMSIDDAVNTWCDMVHVIGTTKSHQVTKNGVTCDRFRVALLWSDSIHSLRAYRYNMAKIMERYPCDQACKDGARYFYPCKQIVSINSDADAYREDVFSQVPVSFEQINRSKFREMAKAGVIPRKVIERLKNPVAKGRRNITIYGIAKDLARVGRSITEIETMIMRSGIVDISEREMIQAMNNGYKAGMEDMMNG